MLDSYYYKDEDYDESVDCEEFDNYDELTMPELLVQLEYDGYTTRRTKHNYKPYEHYKHIFHFSLAETYNIKTIFSNESDDDQYIKYNSLSITKDTNIDKFTDNLFKILLTVHDDICIFLDTETDEENGIWHTTLLIYRRNRNILEHYDPNGIFVSKKDDGIRNILIFNEIIDKLKTKDETLIFVPSVVLHSFNELKVDYSCSRSINSLCKVVNKSHPGWCQMWSIFIYEMVNRYKSMRTRDIISIIYKSLKGGTYREAAYKAINIIKGYYFLSLHRTNKYIKDDSLKISNIMISDYDPEYIVNDIKLEKLIESNMEERSIGNISKKTNQTDYILNKN